MKNLWNRENQGIEEFIPEGSDRKYKVQDLLGLYDSPDLEFEQLVAFFGDISNLDEKGIRVFLENIPGERRSEIIYLIQLSEDRDTVRSGLRGFGKWLPKNVVVGKLLDIIKKSQGIWDGFNS